MGPAMCCRGNGNSPGLVFHGSPGPDGCATPERRNLCGLRGEKNRIF